MPSPFLSIKCHDGSINKVDQSTKELVRNAVSKAAQKIEPAFFSGLSIHIASDFSNLDEHNAFSKYLKEAESNYSNTRGITDNSAKREIYIQESAFKFDKLINIFKEFSFSADKEIEHTTMHELGHQFDSYYGTDDKLKEEYEALLKKYPDAYENEVQLTKDEEKFMAAYMANNGYSDSAKFKKALFQDLQNLNVKKLDLDEGYFVAEFYNRGLDIIPTAEDIEQGDYSRGEVFAQLFAYIMGSDDGKKEKFVKDFPKTYQVVEDFVAKHSR